MKLLHSNIIRPSMRVKYDKNNEEIVRVRYYDLREEIEEGALVLKEIISSTLYYSFENIDADKSYYSEMPFIQIEHQDGDLHLTVAHYIGEDETGEEKIPEWHDIEIEDFELPEDSEVTELKELMPQEPKIDPLTQIRDENKALELRVEQMKNQLEEDRRINEATTLEVLELMMSML